MTIAQREANLRRGERERAEHLERALSEMHRLSNELHDGRIAPNSAEYQLFSEDAPGREFVSRHFGNWEKFARHCGLELREAKYYYGKAAERRGEWKAIDDEPILSTAAARTNEREAALAPSGLLVARAQRVVWQDRVGRTYSEMRYELR